jgi:PAS domain-containing protein
MSSMHCRDPHIVTPLWIAELYDSDAEPLAFPLPAAWRCDLADDSLTWSPGVFELFGLPRGSRIDRREVVAMYCGESRDLLERLRTEAIARLRSFTFEARVRRADGALRWMRLTADVAVRGGRATHLYGTKQDITAEMAAFG